MSATVEKDADYLLHRYGLVEAEVIASSNMRRFPNQRRYWKAISAALRRARIPRARGNPRADKIVATNYTTRTELKPAAADTYVKMLEEWYKEDLVPRYGEEAGERKSRRQAKKQENVHSFLLSVLGQYAKPGDTVVSTGAGMCHEAAFAPQYLWECLEYQDALVNLARQRDRQLRLNAKSEQWSLFPGDVGRCQDRPCYEVLPELGILPEAQFVYLKHFCGGGTDGTLYQAVRMKPRPIIVAMTCCADRYPGLSYAVLDPDMTFEDYKKLVKLSQKRQSSKGMAAVERIDDMRQRFLRENGYVVERGWQRDASGKKTPSGSYFVAIPGEMLFKNTKTARGRRNSGEMSQFFPAKKNRRRVRRNGAKTSADLRRELTWLGPGVVAQLMFGGTTKQCQGTAWAVASYLAEQGFSVRTAGGGTGKYAGHYDLGVFTADEGWISVDPTAIQFHAPISFSVAHAQAMDSLPDHMLEYDRGRYRFKGTRAEAEALTAQVFEPTIEWSVRGIREGLPAFEVTKSPLREAPKPPIRPSPPDEDFESWREWWEERRQWAMMLERGELPDEFIYPSFHSYWGVEVARRLGGRR